MPGARSAAWWPTDAVALEEASGGASGDGERDGEAAAPDVPQSPTPTALQVVEYYHLDVVGSVRVVTDAQGQVIARHDFLPFGEELAPLNPPVDERLFTGQVRDFGTGLDYFHARQLRVDLGRFTTPDPLTDLAWTDPMLGASNAYGYVQSNPLGFVDPMGAQGDQIVVHPSWWDRFVGWLTGPLVFRSGVEVCLSCIYGPSSPIGGLAGGVGTIGPGPGEPGTQPTKPEDQKKPGCLPASDLTLLERVELPAAKFWARWLGITVGFGMGGSAAAGYGGTNFGVGGAVSGSINADAAGNAARVTSYTFNAFNYGAGVLAGLRVSGSFDPLSPGISGAGDVSFSIGEGLGGGASYDPVRRSGAVTLGAAYGVKYSGSISNLSTTTTTMICGQGW